jgi:hypothetical protein
MFFSSPKRGQEIEKWIAMQIAQAVARKKNRKSMYFFKRNKKSIEHAKAIITLTKKIATKIWHLITNDDIYEDEK